jgi:hypothetical protein
VCALHIFSFHYNLTFSFSSQGLSKNKKMLIFTVILSICFSMDYPFTIVAKKSLPKLKL